MPYDEQGNYVKREYAGGKKRSPHSNFQRGAGVYRCVECGKSTRGPGDVNTDMCPDCYHGSEYVNAVVDGDMTLEEVPEKYRQFVADRV